jgi:hypothetical protein
MASDWALAKAAEFLFGDNLPIGAEVHIKRLAVLLDDVRAEANEAMARKVPVAGECIECIECVGVGTVYEGATCPACGGTGCI